MSRFEYTWWERNILGKVKDCRDCEFYPICEKPKYIPCVSWRVY